MVNNWAILCNTQRLRLAFVRVCSTINSIAMFSTFLPFDSSFLFLLKYSLYILPAQLKYILFIIIIWQIYPYDAFFLHHLSLHILNPNFEFDFWRTAKNEFSLTFASFTNQSIFRFLMPAYSIFWIS